MSLTLKPSSSLTLGGKPAPTAAPAGERGTRPKIQRADPNAVYPESMAELERIDEQYIAELYAILNAEPRQPYVVLVFQSGAAKNEFLRLSLWGPEIVTEWVEASVIAPLLNVSLPTAAKQLLPSNKKPGIALQQSALTLNRPALELLRPPVVEAEAESETYSSDEAQPESHIAFKEATQQEHQRFVDSAETTFWIGIAFSSDDERIRFLAQVPAWGEPTESIYFCGEEVACTLDMTITTPIQKLPRWRSPKRLVAMQGPMTE